jgi:glycosyltransferase involved in cell wall biosynthesis
MRKPFLYLLQTAAAPPPLYNSIATPCADLLVLTWKHKVDGAIFAPGSSWSSGRNLLLKHALERIDDYEYFIFLDDDIRFDKGDWRQFESLLMKYQPAVATPFCPWYEPTKGVCAPMEAQCTSFFDAMFNAFHHEVLRDNVVLPYCTKWDKESWWYSQWIVIQLADLFYRNHVIQLNTIVTGNLVHSAYPKGKDFAKIQRWFETELLAPRALPFMPRDFTRRAVRKVRRIIGIKEKPQAPSPKPKSYRITGSQRRLLARAFDENREAQTAIEKDS